MALDRLTIITSSGLSTVSDYVIDGLRAVGIVTATTVQVGSATTVHTTGVDLGSGNITSHNINSTGIITATGVTVTGDLTVEGTLAYDDVTNIDSVGLGTFRNGLHVIDSNVAIGHSNPTYMLHLKKYGNNEIVLNNTRGSSLGGFGLYDDHLEVNALSNHPLLLKTNSVERLRITSAGNIGIGENNPAAKLDVKDSQSNTVDIKLRNTESDAQMSLYAFGGSAAVGSHFNNRIAMMSWNSTEGIDIITNGTGNNDFRVYTAGYGTNSERFRITSAGLVGIDNTSPGTKLAIGDGTIDSSNVITFGKRVAGTNSNLPVIGHHSDGSGSGIAICATSTDGKIHFFTGNGSAGFGDGSNAERMRIDAIGDVTLGYDGNSLYFQNGFNDSTSRIQNGGATNNSNLRFYTRSSGTEAERLRIDAQGRLGVGVAPKAFHANNKDVIQGSSGYVILGRGTSSLNIGQNFYYDSSDAGKYIAAGAATVYNQSNGSHTFYNASSGSADASASLVERFQIQSDGRVSIGAPAANALGALHIHANQGTDTALWIGDSSTNRYLAINEQGSSQNFNHINTRYNDNGIHAHYILDNPYSTGTGYGSQILFRGYNNGTTAYIETSNEASGSARGTLRLRGADNHGLDVRSTGEVNTTHASNIGYATNAATNTRSLVYTSLDPQKRSTTAAEWYILKTFHPNKSGTVNMHAQMYITSGQYYFTFRVREEGTDEIVFNAGDNGGYAAYATNGNAVHSYKQYKWICPLIKAHKRYYIEMAGSNSAGTSINFNSSQQLFLKDLYIYSMSGGHSDSTGAMLIQQGVDESSSTSYGGTTRAAMSGSVNRDSLNQVQYFAGTESTFLGWFTSRAYNRYLDFELNMNGSYMWFAQAYGYLYSRGQVAGSMISGYTYSNNQILNKYNHTFGNRGWYGSYRTSGGNLCLKFDSGGNGYSEGRIALFIGTHGVANKDWRVLRYRQNDTTSNIF